MKARRTQLAAVLFLLGLAVACGLLVGWVRWLWALAERFQ